MKNQKKFTILYVDDEEVNLRVFSASFGRDYNVLTAGSAKEGLRLLKEESVDLILTDQRMPDMDGVTFLRHTINNFPELNRILVTGYTDFDALKTAVNEARIFQYIQKPWKENQLRDIIGKALELYQLRKENQLLTEQLRLKNQELERANNELVEIDRLKMDFLSIISHEIRTPLNGIIGSLGLLKKDIGDEGTDSISALFNILETSVNRLEKFLFSAERVTQLRSKSCHLRVESFDPEEIVDLAVESKKDFLVHKKCVFEKQIQSKQKLFADINLVQFCVEELIDNALKYSPDETTVNLLYYSEAEWLVLCIEDDGMGFSEKMLKNCFQFFVSDSKSDQQKGLSIAIIKLIMDEHNGQIEIENKEQGGARVKLFFKSK